MVETKETIIRLYDADTFDYVGMIVACGSRWEYREVDNEFLQAVTVGMPLRGVLAGLISFNIVYEIEASDFEMEIQ
ncbi:MAG: hypothetical protein N2316_08290 [Spirochaetes bacterium]|nr:hypothetical protein [Spirochaetota bacterium]